MVFLFRRILLDFEGVKMGESKLPSGLLEAEEGRIYDNYYQRSSNEIWYRNQKGGFLG
jgi:hypothetical protein